MIMSMVLLINRKAQAVALLVAESNICLDTKQPETDILRYLNFGKFTDMKPIPQHFSDRGLRNDKSTKNSARYNCVNRASI